MDYLPKDPAILVSSVRSSSARLLPKGRKNMLLRDHKRFGEEITLAVLSLESVLEGRAERLEQKL